MPLAGNSGSPQPAISASSAPSGIPKTAPVATAIRSWQRRYTAAKNAGIPTRQLMNVARDDLKRVSQGRAPLTNTEAGVAVRARMTGETNPLGANKKDDTGFFGDVLSDVQDIGQGLNPIKLVPAVAGQVKEAITDPEQTVEGLANVATGVLKGGPFTKAGTKDLTEALNTPVVGWIPGLYTASTFGREGLSGLLEHPLMTGLDIYPYAKGLTAGITKSAIGAGTIDDIVTRGAAEKLSRLKTLRPDDVNALPESLRAKLNNTLEPLSPREQLIQAGAQGKPVSALARLISPKAVTWADAGVESYKLRMGMGNVTRHVARQHSIMERGLHAMARDREAQWLASLEDLTDVEAQQALHIANHFHTNMETPVREGYTRVYRGQGSAELPTHADDFWYTTQRNEAVNYAQLRVGDAQLENLIFGEGFVNPEPTLYYVDVPTSEISAHGVGTLPKKYINDFKRADLEPPTYNPKVMSAVQATREFSDWMAEQSKAFPDMELTSVPLPSGRRAWYGATGKEGEVARAYKLSVKAEDHAVNSTRTLADAQNAAIDMFRSEQERRVARLEEIHARQVAGRTASPTPNRPFTGIAPLNNVFAPISNFLRNFVTDSRSTISTRNLGLSDLSETLMRYQRVLDEMDNNPGLTTRQIITLAKENLPKEELVTFAQYLEENGISHVANKAGREIDIWKQLGQRKPGRVTALAPKPTAAAKTLNDLEIERAKLADGSYVFEQFGTPEQRAAARELNKLKGRQQRAIDRAHDTAVTFRAKREVIPPASFKPMLEEKIKQANINQAAGKAVYQAMGGGDVRALWDLPTGISNYLHTLDPEDLALVEPEYQAIVQDIFSTWEKLDEAGFEPVWVHKADPTRAARELTPRIRGIGNRAPGTLKERSGQPTPSVSDIRVAVKAGSREFLEKLWHNQYIDDVILPYAVDANSARDAVLPLVEIELKNGSPLSREALFAQKIKEIYTEFTPENPMFGTTAPKTMKFAQEHGKMYLPKTIEKVAKQLLEPKMPGAIGKVAGKTTAIFKFSVLGLSPKHMVNQAIADNMWLLLRGGKEELNPTRWLEALRAVKRGEMPTELSTHIDPLTPDQNLNAAIGKTMGRIFKEGKGNPRNLLTAMYRFEETITNMQRMVAYKSELARAGKSGLDDAAMHQAALQHVYKTVLDIDSLTPFERTIAKQVFPFYSFMRYLYNYVLTYPADHPVRAAIIASIARMEKADQDSGLPGMWSDYFFIGQPDVDGNIKAIDTRSLNPVRDLSNMFTFAGFIQQMNPLIGGGLEVMGVNGFTASPELYPNMHFDPQTGRMVTEHKQGFDALLTMAKSVVPQVELTDYFMGLTQEMRQLKATNPEAYRRVLYRNLFIPFTPRDVNIGEEKQKVSLARLDEASRAVSDSLTYGTKLPDKFKMVPYQGKIVPRSVIDALLAAKKDRATGEAPKATIGRP